MPAYFHRQRVLRAPPISQWRARQTLFPTVVLLPHPSKTAPFPFLHRGHRIRHDTHLRLRSSPPDPAWRIPETTPFPLPHRGHRIQHGTRVLRHGASTARTPGMEQRASMYPSEIGPFTTAVPTPSPRAARPTRIRIRKLSFTSHGRSPCSDLTFESLVRSQAAMASRAWHRTRTRWRCGWCPAGRRAAGAQVHRRHHASVLDALHNTPNIPAAGRHGTRTPHGLQHPVGSPPPLLQSTIRLLGGGQGQGIVPLCQGQVLRAHPCLVRITPSSLPLHCPFYRVLRSSGNGVYFCLASSEGLIFILVLVWTIGMRYMGQRIINSSAQVG
jgi:hypothetical protein